LEIFYFYKNKCRLQSQALPQAKYVALPNAGHIAQGDEMIDALINATEDFKQF